MTLNEAKKIAEQDILRRVSNSDQLRDFRFEPAELINEYDDCWVFAAGSADMLEADYAPAAMFAYIDKNDGHPWSTLEINRYFYKDEPSLAVVQPDKVAA